MTESPFVTTSLILSEQANSFDLLRIIAADNRKLNDEDRQALIRAADELEASYRAHFLTYQQLLETQAKLIAVNDRLIAATKMPAFPSLRCTITNGVRNG